MQKGDQGTIPGHLFVFLANRMGVESLSGY